MEEIDGILDVLDQKSDQAEDDSEIQALIEARNQAREARDFQRADSIRDGLLERGIELLDTPQGTHWRRVS
jgi:cysteinyl-tRNA synthetase